VDAHIHFFQSGGLYTRPDVVDLRDHVPYAEERAAIKSRLGRTLRSYLRMGITTVVDVGGPMYNYQIRKDFHLVPDAPDIFVTGPLISTVQPEEFGEQDPPILKAADTETARRLVHRQLDYNPDFIKIWYIVGRDNSASDNFPIVQATVEEAHKHGLPVAVHATQLETAKLALEAGADFLVHSVDDAPVDEEFIAAVRDKGVSYIPTLVVSSNYLRTFQRQHDFSYRELTRTVPEPLGSLMDVEHLLAPGIQRYQEAGADLREMFDQQDAIARDNLLRMQHAGVNIVTGTDAGNIGTLHATSYSQELGAMRRSGLSNAEILRASTSNAARLLGKEREIGQIKAGYRANMLVLANNPLEDIRYAVAPEWVINKGYLIDPDTRQIPSPEDLAQQQLNAYNARHLEAVLAPYHADVEVYRFPNELLYRGKEAMRKAYRSRFENSPDLHCELVRRIVLGNTVIDQESVRIEKGKPLLEAIAIYKIRENKIHQVFFITKD
jgi:cytosine/adenosine deaminase-related metal-dependent hydrolase